jgi:hypothetical protein
MALRPGLATGLPLSACKKKKWDGKLAIETNRPRMAGRQTKFPIRADALTLTLNLNRFHRLNRHGRTVA